MDNNAGPGQVLKLPSLVFGRKDNIMKIKVKFTKPRTYKAIFVFFNDSTSIGEWV